MFLFFYSPSSLFPTKFNKLKMKTFKVFACQIHRLRLVEASNGKNTTAAASTTSTTTATASTTSTTAATATTAAATEAAQSISHSNDSKKSRNSFSRLNLTAVGNYLRKQTSPSLHHPPLSLTLSTSLLLFLFLFLSHSRSY